MQLQLQVVRGTLQNRDGGTAGAKILIPRGRRFVIGTAPDCHMRCAGNSIDPHHCEIFVDRDRVILRDRGSRRGTFVNGTPVDGTVCLFHGDRLQIGRLQFEVCLVAAHPALPAVPPPPPVLNPLPPPLPSSTHETVRDVRETIANEVAEMLIEADSEDRQRRRFDPASREFRPPPPPPPEPASSPLHQQPPQIKTPVKKAPAKLPAPPPIRGNDSVDSANQALLQIFTPAKKKS